MCLSGNNRVLYRFEKKVSRYSSTEYFHIIFQVVLIAGSVGSYGACLHDGSEYHGRYTKNVTAEFIKDWHRPRISALVESNVDFLAIETIPALFEAEIIMDLLRKEFPQQKAWISFTCAVLTKLSVFILYLSQLLSKRSFTRSATSNFCSKV